MSSVKLDNNMNSNFGWSNETDTINAGGTITINSGDTSADYYISDSTGISTITSLTSGYPPPITDWTSGVTSGANSINVGPALVENSIQLGEDFSISAPEDGPAVFRYKDQKMEIGQLFSMFNAFKTLLKNVADDKDFCERHPEIKDIAYGYLVEELKK